MTGLISMLEGTFYYCQRQPSVILIACFSFVKWDMFMTFYPGGGIGHCFRGTAGPEEDFLWQVKETSRLQSLQMISL